MSTRVNVFGRRQILRSFGPPPQPQPGAFAASCTRPAFHDHVPKEQRLSLRISLEWERVPRFGDSDALDISYFQSKCRLLLHVDAFFLESLHAQAINLVHELFT